MLSKAELWDSLAGLVRAEGLVLFDIDLPFSRSGVVRVFVSGGTVDGSIGGGAERSRAVDVDQCAAISRRIAADPQLSSLLGEYGLEVSSPGVNRRLQRPEHFRGAVGERVRVSFKQDDGKPATAIGKLVVFDGSQMELDDELTAARVRLPLVSVQKARVDFSFD